MKVLVAEKCGFCPGVRNAISTAEKLLKEASDTECVCSLGPVIHNRDEVHRLEQAGLTESFVESLILKFLLSYGDTCGREVARQIHARRNSE